MDDLQKEFLVEISFMLESVEESFLKLETAEDPSCHLTDIFRVVHSIKGTAGAVGLTDLGGFAHVVEDLLASLRAGTLPVTTSRISVLLLALDALNVRVQSLNNGESCEWETSALVAHIRAESDTGVSTESTTAAPEAPTESAPASPTPSPAHPAAASASPAAQGENADSLLKIEASRVSALLELIGELLTANSQVLRHPGVRSAPDLRAVVSGMDKTVRELNTQSLSFRMTTLKSIFQKLQRISRDLSIKLDKPVRMTVSGEDTELDRNMIAMLADPLMHLIRNAIDHGLENTADRIIDGKSELGTIHIGASQEGGRVLITIQDDGGGIRREKVIARARKNGLILEARPDEDISDQEAWNFIFAPGFSTADKLTDVSGRGVGLDVVRSNIIQMKGSIKIDSKEGQGTKFTLSLPLTTAITDGMIVEIDQQQYVLPIERMQELVNGRDLAATPLVSGVRVVSVRGELVPYFDTLEVLGGIPSSRRDVKTLVIMDSTRGRIALGIDRVVAQAQVVLKPLQGDYKNRPELAGAAILGDGRVAMVLEIEGFLRKSAERAA